MGSAASVLEAQAIYGKSNPSSSVDEEIRRAKGRYDACEGIHSKHQTQLDAIVLVKRYSGSKGMMFEELALRRDSRRNLENLEHLEDSDFSEFFEEAIEDDDEPREMYSVPRVQCNPNFQRVLESIKQLRKDESFASEGEDINEEEKQHIMEDIEGLRQYAHFHLHPEEHVKTTDMMACERNYFTRSSAPEQETYEEAEEHHRILEEAAMLEENVQNSRYHRSLQHDYFHNKTEEMLVSSPVCVKSIIQI